MFLLAWLFLCELCLKLRFYIPQLVAVFMPLLLTAVFPARYACLLRQHSYAATVGMAPCSPLLL